MKKILLLAAASAAVIAAPASAEVVQQGATTGTVDLELDNPVVCNLTGDLSDTLTFDINDIDTLVPAQNWGLEIYCNVPFSLAFSAANGALLNENAADYTSTLEGGNPEGGIEQINYRFRPSNDGLGIDRQLETDGFQAFSGAAGATYASEFDWTDSRGDGHGMTFSVNRDPRSGNPARVTNAAQLFGGLYSETVTATLTATP